MIYLISAVGLIFRLISLNQSLWLDEATSVLAAKMTLTDLFSKFLPGDFHPPLYYLILKYWTVVFGYSEVALRVPSIIFGILTVYFVYLIGREIFNQKTGLIASVLLATSGLAIYYSQEARMYAMAAFFVTASIYFFIRKKWIFFAVFLALTGMTDYVSLLILPIFLILGWKEIKKIIVSFIPLIFVFLLWLPVFLVQLRVGLSVMGSAWWSILGILTFKNVALIPVKFLIGRISFDNKLLYGVIVAAISIFFGYLLFLARKTAKVIWFWLIIPIAIGIITSFVIPTLAYFRFLFCLPALYILAAYGIEKLKKFGYLALGLVLAVNLATSGYYLATYRFQREDWRSAAKAIGSDKIILPSSSQSEALVYYGRESQIVKTSQLTKTDKRIWLSRYAAAISDPTDATRLKIESLGYNKASEFNFNGVVFWEYLRK